MQMRRGFMRLQAVFRSKKLSLRFRLIHQFVIDLQKYCRGYLYRQKMKVIDFSSPHPNLKLDTESVDCTDSQGKTEIRNVEENKTFTEEKSAESKILQTSSEDTFAGFAAKYFHDGATNFYFCTALRKPLLDLNDVVDQIASLAVWTVIIKYMLDIPDDSHVKDTQSYRSVMTRLRETLKKQLTIEDLQKAVSGIEVNGRLTSNSDEQSSSTSSNSDLSILISNARLNCFLEDPPITDLEKVSFIAGLGILRKELRDEIYCQLCKQLTNNPDNSSVTRGWLLLCLCTACFPPSEKFYPCLSKFVSDSSSPYASCEHFLKQVFMKGVRKYPPTWMEIQFLETKKPISLGIILTDDSEKLMNVNLCTTVKELLKEISENLSLKDSFGFSLFSEKLLRLEDESYVMDVVAHCEQDAREGGFEEDGTCKLLLRKEFFSPWHDPSEDLVATNLIYSQVVKGVFIDEYSPDKDDDRAMFAAQRYFIENGQKLDKNVLKSLIDTYIPETYLMDDGDVDRWTDLVADKLKDSYFQNPKIDPLKVKQDVVTYARYKWPLLFSRFYEVNKILGPKLSKNQALIAVNWTGVYAVDDEEQILLELSFPEILSVTVSNSKTSDMTMRSVELSTINGEKYTCLSRTADSLTNLIKTFLDGLQERSKFAVALQSYNSPQLNLKQGDFIILDLQSPNLQGTKKDTYIGHNMNNNQKGSFPAECVYKIPTIAKPPLIILNLLTHWANSQKDVEVIQLKSDPAKPEQKEVHRKYDTVNPDQIFCHALVNDLVRDEIFCLLMKQLTDNKNSVSIERGWELMWLAVGLCEPSATLLKELKLFLSTRSNKSLAADCLRRLERRSNKKARKLPPHLEEVEAVQQKILMISHEVHFPNGSDEMFEIDSSTSANELCQEIAKFLGLKSADGFSLYVQIMDRFLSIPGESFYFDFLRPLTAESKTKTKIKGGHGTLPYQLLFQKKIWVETVPGEDLQADLIFHYNQMFPSYFKGYHKCSIKEAAQLGALIYRVMNGDNESNFSQFPELLSELIPVDLLCEQPTQEWTNEIISAFHMFTGKNSDESTVEFLKILSTLGTFGSEFYEVNQVSMADVPKKVLLAINENGVHFMNIKTKELHKRYPLSKLAGCKSDDSSFTILLKGSLETVEEIKCLTQTGYRMLDLLSSYVKLIN
ncbi:hypothetical protein Btru_038182 [Bulinus truncatus]|nr:hypothetical protein Btru_038182 [Bulinus truncatus]